MFNLIVGRDIMPAFGQAPQIVMTTPLLEGLDGVEKMSKSLGNYVGMNDTPDEMFGKLMSISDELMWRYYALLTDLTAADIDTLKAQVAAGTLHPKAAKVDLARRIVTEFHDAKAADLATAEFDRVHARGELPTELKEVPIDFDGEPTRALSRVIVDAGLSVSTSEAARKIQQGGVRLNGERISDPRHRLGAETLPATLQVGRQTLRLLRR